MIKNIAQARKNYEALLTEALYDGGSSVFSDDCALSENLSQSLVSCKEKIIGKAMRHGEKIDDPQAEELAKQRVIHDKLKEFDANSTPKSPWEDIQTGMKITGMFEGGIIKGMMSLSKEDAQDMKEFVGKLSLAFKEGLKGMKEKEGFMGAFSSAWEKYSADGNLELFTRQLGLNPTEQKNFMLALESAQLPDSGNGKTQAISSEARKGDGVDNKQTQPDKNAPKETNPKTDGKPVDNNNPPDSNKTEEERMITKEKGEKNLTISTNGQDASFPEKAPHTPICNKQSGIGFMCKG